MPDSSAKVKDSLAALASQHHPVIVSVSGVFFDYVLTEDNSVAVLQDVSLEARQGQHLVILGRNGSGKSTLAKLINGLELPAAGVVRVLEMDTSDDRLIWEIRRRCGMVFQNPDNQIVGTTVEEDVAFGPENLGIPPVDIRKRIDEALQRVGLTESLQKSPANLSGGQKQKLAVAGILAMEPSCIILDEATAMLDPASSRDLMTLIEELRKQRKLTVIDITHNMEAALQADYIYVLKEGRIAFQGEPRVVYAERELLLSCGLDLPAHLETLREFEALLRTTETDHSNRYPANRTQSEVKNRQTGTAQLNRRPFTAAETADYLLCLGKEFRNQLKSDNDHRIRKPDGPTDANHSRADFDERIDHSQPVLSVNDLSFAYQKGTPLEQTALRRVSFDLMRGELVALAGHSGSGKSTLISHLNGLIKPQSGSVTVFDQTTANKKELSAIRQKVGLLFQYPEYQLFEMTVYDDIAFGPKRYGIQGDELEKRVRMAAELVNLSPDLLQRSPFDLSGGQKRRVAIAGVLALDSEIYVLDEPAAGLDPEGRDDILKIILNLRQIGKTILFVTHNMNDAARVADRVLVMREGELIADRTPEAIFRDSDLLRRAGLEPPAAATFSQLLELRSGLKIGGLTPAQVARNYYFRLLGGESNE